MSSTAPLPFSFNFAPLPVARVAKAPFDDSRADIILRSSDGVEFHVYKVILSLISPVLSERFEAAAPRGPWPKVGDATSLPVVYLSEDSESLDLVLRHCYPTRSPELSQSKDAQVLLEFAYKYKVDALGPSLTHYLMDAIGKDPVGTYALAAKYEYKDVSLAAAEASLELPLSRLTSADLASVSVEKYQQLIRYHSSCGEAASAVTLRRDWFPSGNKWLSAWPFGQTKDSSCCMIRDVVQDRITSESKFTLPRSAPRYLWSYLNRAALVLAYQPSVAVVTTEEFVLKDMDCPVCTNIRRTDMIEFSRIFGAEIKKAIEQVHFTEKGNSGKTITSASSSPPQNSAPTVNASSVPVTENGSGGKTTSSASSSSSTSQNSAKTVNVSSVPVTEKGSGGNTTSPASSSTSQNSATNVNANSVPLTGKGSGGRTVTSTPLFTPQKSSNPVSASSTQPSSKGSA